MSNRPKVPDETTILARDCCLCLHLQCAARAVAFDQALRPLDLTNGQFSLLMSLNRPAPPAMADVASLLAMYRTTLTAALKPLERRGFVTVTSAPADLPSRLIALTPKVRMLTRAVPIWERTHQEIERLLPDETRTAFGAICAFFPVMARVQAATPRFPSHAAPEMGPHQHLQRVGYPA